MERERYKLTQNEKDFQVYEKTGKMIVFTEKEITIFTEDMFHKRYRKPK